MRQTIALCMVFITIWVMAVPVAFADNQDIGPPQLSEVEMVLYGETREGPLLTRLERVELEVFGQVESGSTFPVRLQRLAKLLIGAEGDTSLKMKLNAIEWAIFRKINEGPSITDRLDEMELAMFGETRAANGFTKRLNDLLHLMWPGGTVYVGEEVIPEGTLIKIRLLTELNSEVSKVDDIVRYVVIDDVIVNHKITIASGATGEGRIISIDTAGRLGRDGNVHVDFGTVVAMDSSKVGVQIESRASERNRNVELAAGASIVGAAVLGPLGLAAGLFITGKESVIPAGSEFYVEVAQNETVDALSLVPLK